MMAGVVLAAPGCAAPSTTTPSKAAPSLATPGKDVAGKATPGNEAPEKDAAGKATPGGGKAAADDGFRASILAVDNATARAMIGVSYHRGCPVPISDLRRVLLTHWDFDGRRHQGELFVHKDIASRVVAVFHALYTARYPIRRMSRIDRYRGDDNASMVADNTSAYNCRPVAGWTRGFSKHSYGKAIDINPLENPYVKGRTVLPPAGKAFTDRAKKHPSMIRRNDRVWRAFTARGFTWGGEWRSLKDYQHFEAPI